MFCSRALTRNLPEVNLVKFPLKIYDGWGLLFFCFTIVFLELLLSSHRLCNLRYSDKVFFLFTVFSDQLFFKMLQHFFGLFYLLAVSQLLTFTGLYVDLILYFIIPASGMRPNMF